MKNALPRAAALLDVMQVSDVIAVHGADTFERPVYAGNAVETVRSTDRIKVLTVRTAAFAAAGEDTVTACASCIGQRQYHPLRFRPLVR